MAPLREAALPAHCQNWHPRSVAENCNRRGSVSFARFGRACRAYRGRLRLGVGATCGSHKRVRCRPSVWFS